MNNISENSRIYVDSNIFIYFVEGVPGFFEQISDLFELIAHFGAKVFTSEITIAECIYKPSATGDELTVLAYEKIFRAKSEIHLTTIDVEISSRAAKLGGTFDLKLLDSIHYLSALEAGCDYFVTSDKAFKPLPNMTVIHIRK